MGDVVYLALIVAFFGAAFGLIAVCEWMVRGDDDERTAEVPDTDSELAERI